MKLPDKKEVFTPRWQSLFSSLALVYSVSPACLAGATLYFGPRWWRHSLVLLIPSALMGIISAILLLQDIVVYTQKLYISPAGIGTTGVGSTFVMWAEVEAATIRERHNLLSGTDRLLTLTAKGDVLLLGFVTSVLSKEDENRVLLLVRKLAPTSTKFDKGSF